MNRTANTFIRSLLIAGILLLSLSVFGQNKTLTKTEYDSAISAAGKKESSVASRITSVTTYYSNEKVTEKTTIKRENLPPDRSSWKTIIEKDGKINVTFEEIIIGEVKYRKNDKSLWESNKPEGKITSTMRADTSDPVQAVDCREYLLFDSRLNGQIVKMYFSYQVTNIKNLLYFIEDRHWISLEGLTLASSTKVSKLIPTNVTSNTITNYIYDPKDLKIEAPVTEK